MRLHFRCAGIIFAGTLTAMAMGCGRPSPAAMEETPPDGRSSIQAESQMRSITLPPLRTYAQYCERCHGPDGTFFAGQFLHVDEESLRMVTADMMIGKSMLDPTEADIAAMTAYMRAIQLDAPFAVVLEHGDAGVTGESRPGTEVAVTQDATNAAAIKDAPEWRVEGAFSTPLTVLISQRGVSNSFSYPDARWPAMSYEEREDSP